MLKYVILLLCMYYRFEIVQFINLRPQQEGFKVNIEIYREMFFKIFARTSKLICDIFMQAHIDIVD